MTGFATIVATQSLQLGAVSANTLLYSSISYRRFSQLSSLLFSPPLSVPVGHIWKFDLETLNFGVKFNFSKIRMGPVMHDFLAITESQKREVRTIE